VNFNAKQKHTEKVQSFDEVRKLHLNYLGGLGNSCFEEFPQKCTTAERKKNYCLDTKKFQSFELYKVWSNKTEKAQSFADL
jgi:hypothetical protein